MRDVELFRGCSEEELRVLARAFDAIDVQAGHVLISQGRVGSEALVLASGSAEVTVDGAPIACLGAGSIVGEMALLDRGPRTATVTVSADATVLVTDPQRFRGVLAQVPQVSQNVLTSLSQRLRRLECSGDPV